MTSHRTVLITGGTGFLGSHFIYRVLQAGGRVVAITRGEDPQTARQRLISTLEAAAASYDEAFDAAAAASTLDVVPGDITLSRAGLDDDTIARWQGRVHELWHGAASLKFEDELRDEIRAHNLGGTAHTLELAAALGVERFVHVSTAYTSGLREGRIPEAPVPEGTRHNNHYEATKAEAERLVAARCEASRIDWRVLRPSIVIGPSSTHRTGGSSTGLYGFVREVLRLRRALADDSQSITLSGDGELLIDLVPVDSVVADMLALWRDGSWQQRFHHLTHPEPLVLGEVIRCICQTVGVQPFRLVPGYVPQSSLERLIDRKLVFYRSYFHHPKRFERSLPAPPPISLVDIQRYVEQSLDDRTAGEPPPRAPSSHDSAAPGPP
jgi:nucleoside-diphosphate-sugar epimerase